MKSLPRFSSFQKGLSIDNIEMMVNQQREECCPLSVDNELFQTLVVDRKLRQVYQLITLSMLSIYTLVKVVDRQQANSNACCQSRTSYFVFCYCCRHLTLRIFSLDNTCIKLLAVDRQHQNGCQLITLLMFSIDNPNFKLSVVD